MLTNKNKSSSAGQWRRNHSQKQLTRRSQGMMLFLLRRCIWTERDQKGREKVEETNDKRCEGIRNRLMSPLQGRRSQRLEESIADD